MAPGSNIDEPVRYVKGVGPKKEKLLPRLLVTSVADLLTLLPIRYEDRSVLTTVAAA